MFSQEVIIETLKHSVASAAIFLILWFVLGKFVFKPYLSLLDERDERTRGDEKRALSKAKEAEVLVEKIEDELRSSTIEGVKTRDAHISKAKTVARDVISAASKQSKLEVEAARDEIIKIKLEAKKEISSHLDSITQSVISKVLTSAKDRVDASSVH